MRNPVREHEILEKYRPILDKIFQKWENYPSPGKIVCVLEEMEKYVRDFSNLPEEYKRKLDKMITECNIEDPRVEVWVEKFFESLKMKETPVRKSGNLYDRL